jgi:hypothetical protein
LLNTQIKKYVGSAEKIVICCCSEIAQFSAKFPQNFVPYHQNQNFMWVFGRIFCENLAENFVPFHHKILREFGRKIFDFVVM